MNILPLVLSILLILTFGFYSCLEKEAAVYRTNKTFVIQNKLSRGLLKTYEEHHYDAIKAAKKIKSPHEVSSSKRKEKTVREIPEPPPINPECSRLNLWPLLQADKKEHPLLYEQLAQLLRLYYQKPLFRFFSERSDFEYQFLDAWLDILKKNLSGASKGKPILLEKAAFSDRSFQILYYNMLRGSKEKYPPLLDFIKAARPLDPQEKLCLLHATPGMLAVFFGEAAGAIYDEMHGKTLAVTEERIEELCRTHHGPLIAKELFQLLNLSRFKHPPPPEITLFEEDKQTKTSMRKKVYPNP